MANETIMQGLLESLMQRPQDNVQQKGTVLANLISQPNPLAAYVAYSMPGQMENVAGAARGLLGLKAPVSPQQQLQEAITTNPTLLNSSAGLTQLAKQAAATGDTSSATQLAAMAAQIAQQEQIAAAQAAKEQRTVAQNTAQQEATIAGLEGIVANSTVADNRKAALLSGVRAGLFNNAPDKLLSAAFPEGTDEYKVVGNNVFNTKTGTWLTAPAATAGAGKEGLPAGIDPDQYDPASFGQFEAAVASAQTPEERKAAYGLLLPKADQGFEWKTVNNTLVQYPVAGIALAKVRGEISAANRARENARTRTARSVGLIDGILGDVAVGKTKPGSTAALLGYVPGTPYWNQRVSLDTLKANLGISALFEARETSPNGSSGFGQLTTRELDRLETMLAPLSVAQTEEAFVAALSQVRAELSTILGSDKGAWDLDTYLGVPPATQPTATTITAPSGNTYTIKQSP